MRLRNTLRYWVGVSALLASASGCAVDSSSTAEATAETIQPVVLADIHLEGEHRIQFVETVPGAVSVSETGIKSADEARLAKLGALSLQDKYVALGGTIEPATFDKLQAAQERVDALNAEVAKLEAAGLGPKIEAPAGQAPAAGGEAVASQQQPLVSEVRNGHYAGYDEPALFRSSWCTGAQLCLLNQTSWDTGFPGNVTFFSSIVMNIGPTGTLTHNHVQYVCLTSIPIIGCVERGWRTVDSQRVLTGAYGYYSDTYKWTRYSASSSGGAALFGAATWRL